MSSYNLLSSFQNKNEQIEFPIKTEMLLSKMIKNCVCPESYQVSYRSYIYTIRIAVSDLSRYERKLGINLRSNQAFT